MRAAETRGGMGNNFANAKMSRAYFFPSDFLRISAKSATTRGVPVVNHQIPGADAMTRATSFVYNSLRTLGAGE